jgi:hypothetical protein
MVPRVRSIRLNSGIGGRAHVTSSFFRAILSIQLWAGQSEALLACLPQLRQLLCEKLGVVPNGCQLTVIVIEGPADQPAVNVEMAYLASPKRTRSRIEDLARAMSDLVGEADATPVAVRCAQLDPRTYLALKGCPGSGPHA